MGRRQRALIHTLTQADQTKRDKKQVHPAHQTRLKPTRLPSPPSPDLAPGRHYRPLASAPVLLRSSPNRCMKCEDQGEREAQQPGRSFSSVKPAAHLPVSPTPSPPHPPATPLQTPKDPDLPPKEVTVKNLSDGVPVRPLPSSLSLAFPISRIRARSYPNFKQIRERHFPSSTALGQGTRLDAHGRVDFKPSQPLGWTPVFCEHPAQPNMATLGASPS